MLSRWRLITTVVAIGAVAACASHDTTTSPSQFSMAGIWNQGARLQDTTLLQTHIHSGYFFFDQQGNSFAGTVSRPVGVRDRSVTTWGRSRPAWPSISPTAFNKVGTSRSKPISAPTRGS